MQSVSSGAVYSALLNKIYPVGSIYMSVNSTSPQTFLGGTWERITGRFLLGATDGGSSGASQKAGNTGGGAPMKRCHDEVSGYGLVPSNSFGDRVIIESGTGDNMPPYLSVYMWKRTA